MEKKVKDYTVISEQGTEALIKNVLDKVKYGWTPLGGVSVASVVNKHSGILIMSQAMVMYEETDNTTNI